MPTYQVSMPDGSAYHVDMPDTPQPSTMDTVKNTVSGIGEAVSHPMDTVNAIGAKSELGQIPDLGTLETAAASIPRAAMNAYDTVRSVNPLDKNYANSTMHTGIEAINQEEDTRNKNVPYSGTANFLGQAIATPTGDLNLVGDTAKGASMLTKVGKSVGRGAESVASGAGMGAEFAAEQPTAPTNNSEDLANQTEQKLKTGATAGGIVGAGMGALDKAKDWFTAGKNWIGKAGIEKSVGENLPDVLGQQGMSDLQNHVNNPNAKDLTVADITQNPSVASAERGVAVGNDKTNLDIRRQATNSQLASEVKANIPELNAPTPVEAQENAGSMARNVSNTERQGIKDAYKAVAPDHTITAPLEGIQQDFDAIREQNHSLIHGDEETGPDRVLSEIDNRYSAENESNTGSVKQMIQDKNNLGSYVNSQYKALKAGTLDSDQQYLINKKIGVAQQMRDSLKENLSNMTDVPSGTEDMSVGEAFDAAEGKFKEYQNKYLDNPEQYKVNDQGTEYGKSSSAFGDYDERLQKGTAGSLAQEGKNILPIENPDALGASLKNLRNAPNADQIVKDNLLATIKDKGYKAYTPEVQAQLEKNGFADVAKDVKTQGLLHDIREKSLSTEPNSLGSGSIDKVDYEKYYDTFNKNRNYLKANLPTDQFNALNTLGKELQQNTFMERTNAGAENTIVKGSTAEKANEIAVQGAINKIAGLPIGSASKAVAMFRGMRWEKVNEIVQDALTNPQRAVELINAAKAAPKDPGLFKQFIDTAYSKLPGLAGATTQPINVEKNISPIDNEVNDVTKPQSFLSQFSPVSDANASEFPGKQGGPVELTHDTSSKKNNNNAGEFQIADAASQTGMPQEYFHALEKAETQGTKDPNMARPLDAKGKPKSSAFGRGQFTEATWNDMADKHNLPPVTDSNRYTHNDPRSNPMYSRLATGYYGADNAAKLTPWLKDKFNRDATVADVYGAHLMGLSGFKQIMSASPSAKADSIVPAAAKNNKSLFYDNNGKPVSVRQLYHNMEDRLTTSKPIYDNIEPDGSP